MVYSLYGCTNRETYGVGGYKWELLIQSYEYLDVEEFINTSINIGETDLLVTFDKPNVLFKEQYHYALWYARFGKWYFA